MELGETIDNRFVVERWVASGGMGAIYRALDRSSGAPVALKVLTVRSREHAARFVREAEVLSRFRDPGVVAHVAHGALPGGDAYLVTEWLDGGTLAELLAKRRLTCEEALGLLRHAAKALGHAHAARLVHRDVTPKNLFVCRGGEVPLKVLDFGLVRILDQAGVLTRTGVGLGTPGYLSPEQLAGERDLDARGDVFALGCVLHEAIAGAPPFGAGDAVQIMRRTMFEDAPALDPALGVPGPVSDLVRRMMARDPDERPLSGGAVFDEMTALFRMIRKRLEIDRTMVRQRAGRTYYRGSGGGAGCPREDDPMSKNHVMAALAVGFSTLLPIAGGCASGDGDHADAHVGEPGREPAALVTNNPGRLSPTVLPPVVMAPVATATATAPPPSSLATLPKDLCLKTFGKKYEGYFCEEKGCGEGPDPFLQFEYAMYSNACLAGGTPPSAQNPTGLRGVVMHVDVNKEERLWLYGVCPMDDKPAMDAVTKFHKIDPVDSFVAYYCYPDGVISTSPTREHTSTSGAGVPTTWTETALAFVPVWDPRCPGCVTGDGLKPPAAPIGAPLRSRRTGSLRARSPPHGALPSAPR
jgi:hypothetical protein